MFSRNRVQFAITVLIKPEYLMLASCPYAHGYRIYPRIVRTLSFGKERSRGDFSCETSTSGNPTRIVVTSEMCVKGGGGRCGTSGYRAALMTLLRKPKLIARGKRTRTQKLLFLEGRVVVGKCKHFTHMLLCSIKQM